MPSLSTNPPKTIGILTSGLAAILVKQAWQGFEKALDGTGFELELFETQPSTKVEENVMIKSVAMDSRVAGVIHVAMPLTISQLGAFKDQGMPLVSLTSRTEGMDWVVVDDTIGAYNATKHLLNLGHRRIGLINGPAVDLVSRLREIGFVRALVGEGISFGIDAGIEILNYQKSEGYDAAMMLMDLPARPTGLVVAAGDLTALGVLAALKDRDIRVPGDVSVVGYDDLDFSAETEPPLTTIRQPLKFMGEKAMGMLLHAIQNPDSHNTLGEILEAKLVERESTGPPPG